MIRGINADKKSFKAVKLKSGFNLIIANKAEDAEDKDSRNGVGKTSLIEILHYCLGANHNKCKILSKKELKDWTFSIDLDFQGKKFTVSRDTGKNNDIVISGDVDALPEKPSFNDKEKHYFYKNKIWTAVLGQMMFGLIPDSRSENNKYAPSFRGLISYFARKGIDAYNDPFNYFQKQPSWQSKVFNAFLLSLSWEYSQEWQIIKDREENIKKLKKATQSGFFSSLVGSVGELEAEKVRLEGRASAGHKELKSFKVHPRYADIEDKANEITLKIHELSNENVSDKQLLHHYRNNLKEEKVTKSKDVKRIYEQAGIVFPEAVSKRLEDVKAFHHQIVENRRDFLQEEIENIEKRIEDRRGHIKSLSDERAEQMKILETHRALESYNYMREQHTKLLSEIENINNQIKECKKLQDEEDDVKIEKSRLQQVSRKDYEERKVIRDEAIETFNSHSEYLYESPGSLIIDSEEGYKFNVEIERSESEGFSKMKTLCYDLTFTKLLTKRNIGPQFLVHDSSIFADVDERQVAKALQLAAKSAEEFGFQYIAFLNSGSIPSAEYFDDGFNIQDYVALELKDHPESACLFGFRF